MREPKVDSKHIKMLKGSFVAFLFVLWAALNLPVPTKQQISMSKKLAAGDSRRFILQACRGIGKSFITSAFVVWKLWNNPDLKIMIVSANKDRADANSVFIKRIIDLLPFLHELKPRAGQRDSSLSFDVGPARPDHSPSVKSVGVTGGMTGWESCVCDLTQHLSFYGWLRPAILSGGQLHTRFWGAGAKPLEFCHC